MYNELKEIIDKSSSIVFFGGAAYRPKAEYLIFVQKPACITQNANSVIHPRRCCRTPFY